jgi:hypothetical protein
MLSKFGANCKFLTSDGSFKPVEKLMTNDYIYNSSGTLIRILKIKKSNELMYKIVQNNGIDNYILHPTSKIYVRYNGNNLTWSQIDNGWLLEWSTGSNLQKTIFKLEDYANDKVIAFKEAKKYLNDKESDMIGQVYEIVLDDYIKKDVEWKHKYKLFQQIVHFVHDESSLLMDPYLLGY